LAGLRLAGNGLNARVLSDALKELNGLAYSPYAVRDYDAVNPDYGTKDDLKRLVSEAHKRDVKVMLDVVLLHTTWDNALMQRPEFYKHDATGKIVPPVFIGDDYRNRFALYKSAAALKARHATAPWFVTWDDHEVDNNYAGMTPALLLRSRHGNVAGVPDRA
jgi:glycosidase